MICHVVLHDSDQCKCDHNADKKNTNFDTYFRFVVIVTVSTHAVYLLSL